MTPLPSVTPGAGATGHSRTADRKRVAASVLVVGAEWFDERPGGLPRYVKDLVGALGAGEIAAEAVLLGPAVSAGPNVHAVSRPDAPLWQRLWAFHRAVASRAPSADVVDVHFALYGALPILLRALGGTPLVVHFHGPWAAEAAASGQKHLRATLQRRLERLVYGRADAVIVLSSAFRDILVEDYGVQPHRIHVIPPGVDLVRFDVGPREASRKPLGLGAEAFVAVCTRRLESRMGLDVLLSAWRRVQEEVPGSVLLLAGDGPARGALAPAISALPRPDDVRVLGHVDDDELVSLYRAANCSIVPSVALEGFGLVVLESAACGTPPIVTDCGGLPDGVKVLDESLVVKAGDAGALADRIVAAARGSLPTQDACRAHSETYSWAEAVRRHRDVLDAITTSARLPGAGRPRVAFVDHCAVLSGAELALVRLLRVLDVDAHVILGDDGPLRARLEEVGATVHVLELTRDVRDLPRERVGWSAVRQLGETGAYSVALTRLLRRLQPDVVHTNSLKAALYGGLAGRLARVPVVWHIHDRIAPDYLGASAAGLVMAAIHVLPSGVIVNSTTTLRTLGRLRVPVTSIPPVVDLEPAAPVRSQGTSLRFGVVGRLAPWKGQDLFLRAFARAFPESDVEAVIVGSALFGEGDFEVELKELAGSLGLERRVDFRGFRDDVAAEFGRLDVAVHASTLPEPFGQVVVEAMTAGTPVVVANEGGPAEIVEDGVTGLTYAAGDERALADALQRLAEDPELRRRLGDAGRDASQAYRPEVVAADVLAFYKTIGR